MRGCAVKITPERSNNFARGVRTSMLHLPDEIGTLLPLLDEQTAEDLESETLDFKECPSEEKLKELSREMAVCFGNTAGGTVVFGVADRVLGRERAVIGINFAPDLDAIKAFLYDAIDPKLPVQFAWLLDGSKRLLLMHVLPATPPYTTTSGRGWVRIGNGVNP